MGNRITYIKKLKDYEMVMLIGYVDKGQCSIFIRNSSGEKVFDFGIVGVDTANELFRFFDSNLVVE
jgi:hypothetical protein